MKALFITTIALLLTTLIIVILIVPALYGIFKHIQEEEADADINNIES